MTQQMQFKGYLVLIGDGDTCGRCGVTVPSQLLCPNCKGQFCLVGCVSPRQWGNAHIACPWRCEGAESRIATLIPGVDVVVARGANGLQPCPGDSLDLYRIRYGGGWLEGLRAEQAVSLLIPNITAQHRDRLIVLYREQYGDEWLDRLQDDRKMVEQGYLETTVPANSIASWRWERRNGTLVAVITVSSDQARVMAPKPGDVIAVFGRDGQSSRQVVLRGWPEPNGDRFNLVVEVEKHDPHGRHRAQAESASLAAH